MDRFWNFVLFFSVFAFSFVFAWLTLTNLVLFFISHFFLPLIFLFASYHFTLLLWQQYELRSKVQTKVRAKVLPNCKAVLITGCDSGFGLWLALDLLEQDFTVFAGCLRIDSDGAKQLKKHRKAKNRLIIVALDVTSSDSVKEAHKVIQNELQSRRLHLYALVNNAGIMASCEIEFGSIELFERQLSVNCLGAIRVTKTFLPLLRDASLVRQGLKQHVSPMDSVPRVLNMCSLAGRHAIPGINAYCVSKAALINFTEGLRRELSKWSIDVISIEPHLFKTNLVYQERQLNDLTVAWNESPEDTRTAYGQQYYEKFSTFVRRMLETARGDTRIVVQTVQNALLDPAPCTIYRVLGHPIERVRFWIYDFLPDALLDHLAFFMMKIQVGQPQALESKNSKVKSN